MQPVAMEGANGDDPCMEPSFLSPQRKGGGGVKERAEPKCLWLMGLAGFSPRLAG